MPSHKIHKLTQKIVLGKTFEDVDKLMDLPIAELGSKHRVLLHDSMSLLLVYMIFGKDNDRFKAALLHAIVDGESKNPEIKAFFEAVS